ncbi:HEPN domain-containing protein [candidate division KSB1 bacterium]|nr:HEPN domain-containing protein [candidate division KSB1 bacterium]
MDIIFEKKHNLSYLLDLLSDKIDLNPGIYKSAEILNDYAIEIRYPTAWNFPDTEEVREAFRSAKTIKRFVIKKISI